MNGRETHQHTDGRHALGVIFDNMPDVVPAHLLDAVARRASDEGLVEVGWTVHDSPVGALTLAATATGVVCIAYREPDETLDLLAGRISARILRAPGRLDAVRRQLDEYFAGRRRSFEVPLDWQLSRGFRRAVLAELVQVPYGRTISYKQLAERAGNPRAVRAAGSAMATNPLPIVVPCHRVVRTGGELGQYGGGVDAKEWLLRHESARRDDC
jgi:methylated-DNA-[protein]-cysteine S-methyltransferase